MTRVAPVSCSLSSKSPCISTEIELNNPATGAAAKTGASTSQKFNYAWLLRWVLDKLSPTSTRLIHSLFARDSASLANQAPPTPMIGQQFDCNEATRLSPTRTHRRHNGIAEARHHSLVTSILFLATVDPSRLLGFVVRVKTAMNYEWSSLTWSG